MDPKVKKLMQAAFQDLPGKSQQIIRSLDMEKVLSPIIEVQQLDPSQRIAVENEIMLVFLGFDNVENFVTNVKYSAQISRERAERIAKSINREIFIPNQAALNIKSVQKEMYRPDSSTKIIDNNNNYKQTEKHENKSTSQDTPQDLKPKEIDMFHKKLTQQVHIPKEEERINLEEKEVKEKPKQDTPPVDPYREPID